MHAAEWPVIRAGGKIDRSRGVWRQRREERFPLLTHSLTRPLLSTFNFAISDFVARARDFLVNFNKFIVLF